MLGLWLKNWRRRKWARGPFPDAWEATLHHFVPLYQSLSESDRQTLRRLTVCFVREKYWEGCADFAVTDEVKVAIAGTACLLVLGFPGYIFDRLLSVLVYPNAYLAQQQTTGPGGVQTETREPRLGEAWSHGPVILSWEAICEPDGVGRNVIVHEFAHCLDLEEGEFNGCPILPDDASRERWDEVTTREFNKVRHRAAYGHERLIDSYAATNPAEFFAVTSEVFFTRPTDLQRTHAELYSVLASFYRQDPAARLAAT